MNTCNVLFGVNGGLAIYKQYVPNGIVYFVRINFKISICGQRTVAKYSSV